MPTVVGQLDNVPSPGDAIRSPWAMEISGYVVHPFASFAALTAAWPSAPAGSLALALDTSILYVRKSAVWQPFPPQYQVYSVQPSGTCTGGAVTIATLPITSATYPRRLFPAGMCSAGGIGTNATSTWTFTLTWPDASTTILSAVANCTAYFGGQGPGVGGFGGGSYLLPAGTAASFTLSVARSSGAADTGTVYADARFNQLIVYAYPA